MFNESLTVLILASSLVAQIGGKAADRRTWEQVVESFLDNEAGDPVDGERDGRRLLELDRRKAVTFLKEHLDRSHSLGIRRKAIWALGGCSVAEAFPEFASIARDEKENRLIRAAALSPGLRYMKRQDAVDIAASLMNSPDGNIRRSAYLVLSEHGTDQCVRLLQQALNRQEDLVGLVGAIAGTNNPKAGKIVFDAVDLDSAMKDRELLRSYVRAMVAYKVKEAIPLMFRLTDHEDNIVALNAIQFFREYPQEELVPRLVGFVLREDNPLGHSVYDTFLSFLNSPNISSASKEKLRNIMKREKMKKPVGWP